MGSMLSCCDVDRCCFCNNVPIFNDDEYYYKIIRSGKYSNKLICEYCIIAKKMKN